MRKKLSFISFLLLTCTLSSMSQRDEEDMVIIKPNVVWLGPRGGVGFTSMGQPDECNLYDGGAAGITFGVALKTRLGRATRDTRDGGTGRFGFELDALYKQNNVNTIGSDKLSLGYFELPLTFHYHPMTTSKFMNKFYVEAGTSFAFILSKSPSLLDVPRKNVAYRTSDFKGGDVRMLLGMGYTIPKTSLDINARYYIGTSNLAGNFQCKQNTLEISFAWMFQIATY